MKLKIFNGLRSSLILYIIFFIACGPAEIKQKKPKENKDEVALVNMNRYLIKENVTKIKAYIDRQKWNMTETKSGLWYQILKENAGLKCQKDDMVTLNYKVELLDGTFCYSSDSLGLKKFIVGTGKVESGLEEAVLLLHKGDSARLILPPHIAYGTQGDGNCINPNSTVIYHIQVVDIKKIKNK